MKFIAILLTLSASALLANPLPMGNWAYISSEQLTVKLSPDAAVLSGVFTFHSTAANGKFDRDMTGDISIPIWLPESKYADAKTRRLLDACANGGPQPLADEIRPAWNEVIGITVQVGTKSIPVTQYSFVSAPGSRRGKGMSPVYQQKGYCCLLVHVSIPSDLISRGQKVTIAYRQPLHVSREGLEFHYLPVFNGMPTSIATTDLNRFALTLKNETGRRLMLGTVVIRPSATAILPLANFDAITTRTSRD